MTNKQAQITINAIKFLLDNAQYSEDVEEALNMAISALEQRWIPCIERLPEKSGQYYVSGGGKVWICEFLIIPNFIGGWCNDASNPVVQAWMPCNIPEPYREGE